MSAPRRTHPPTNPSMTTAVASPPLIAWSLDSIGSSRPTPWPVGQYDPFSSHQHRRRSPTGFDVPSNPSSIDTRHDPRLLTTHEGLLPQTMSTPAGQTGFPADARSYTTRDTSYRPVPDESSVHIRQHSQEGHGPYMESSVDRGYSEYEPDTATRQSGDVTRGDNRQQSRRRPYNPDEFDGPSQLLPLPIPQQELSRSRALPQQPVSLTLDDQDEIFRRWNDFLAQCAFHFVAKYQFPIPLEKEKAPVRAANDRDWTEWAYLLKRLATKRRIPARVLFENQIRQFVTTLENSITIRQTPNTPRGDQPAPVRAPRDDRYMLQLISSGIQVARILMDSLAMEQLEGLYVRTESLIMERRTRSRHGQHLYRT